MKDYLYSNFKVLINNELVPQHIVQSISISYTDNNLSSCKINFAFRDSSTKLFEKYLDYTGPELKDYFNVAVFFNDRLLFSGIILNISYNRTIQESNLELTAISDFQFASFFKFFAFNIANYNDKMVIYEEKFTYPYFELIGGASTLIQRIYTYLFESQDSKDFIKRLNNLLNFEKMIDDEIFTFDVGFDENQLKEKVKKFHNVKLNSEFYSKYWNESKFIYDKSNIEALLSLFSKSLADGQIVKQIMQNLFQNDRIQALSLLDLILFIFQSYFIEFIDFPSKHGMSIYLKPSLSFAPVPDCNFVHPGQLLNINFSHSVESKKPTRTYLVAKGYLENVLTPETTFEGSFFGLNKTIVAPTEVAKKVYYYLVNKTELPDSKLNEVNLFSIFNEYLNLQGQTEDDYIIAFNQPSREERKRGIIPFVYEPPLSLSLLLTFQTDLSLIAPALFSYIDYIHYYTRSQFDYASVTLTFDPNIIPGVPALVFDGTNFIYGKVNSIIHGISSSGAFTTIILTGVTFNLNLSEKNFFNFNEYYLEGENLKSFTMQKFEQYYKDVFGAQTIKSIKNINLNKNKTLIYKNFQSIEDYISKERSIANDFNQILNEYPSKSFPA
ncbi:MAG: hypothetical protein QXW35_05650 [Candidatus Aenigmatarchaeota archaeon]